MADFFFDMVAKTLPKTVEGDAEVALAHAVFFGEFGLGSARVGAIDEGREGFEKSVLVGTGHFGLKTIHRELDHGDDPGAVKGEVRGSGWGFDWGFVDLEVDAVSSAAFGLSATPLVDEEVLNGAFEEGAKGSAESGGEDFFAILGKKVFEKLLGEFVGLVGTVTTSADVISNGAPVSPAPLLKLVFITTHSLNERPAGVWEVAGS